MVESRPLLGLRVDSGEPVYLTPEGRRQGTYVIGIPGTGKTTLLLNIALTDIEAGDGLCLLDPHGDMAWDLLCRIPAHRINDVILFDPSDIEHPFGLNLFEWPNRDDPRQMDRICSEVMGTFYKLFFYSWGPRMEDLMRHTSLTLLMNEGSTMADMLWILIDPDHRQRFLENIRDPIVRAYWEDRFPTREKEREEWVSSTLNKVGRFLVNPVIRNIVCQPKSTLDFRRIMDVGKVLIVSLSKGLLGEDNSALLGSVIVGKILVAALSRSEIAREKRRPFHLIADEYQSFATASFPTLQSEARKFAIDTIVAHQYRDQLDDLSRGSTLNVGNFVVFRISGRDATELALQFDNTPSEPELETRPIYQPVGREGIALRPSGVYHEVPGPRRPYHDVQAETANQLANLHNFIARCRLSAGVRQEDFVIRTLPLQGTPDSKVAERIRTASRKMALSRREVESGIRRWTLEKAEETAVYIDRR